MHKAWAVAISKAHERPRRMSGTIKTTLRFIVSVGTSLLGPLALDHQLAGGLFEMTNAIAAQRQLAGARPAF